MAAAAAVNLAGLVGLGLALVVVQTLDPAGGLGTGASLALSGRLWLLAQGGELDVGAGPLVLAPLLLTLGIAWGLSRAGRVLASLHDLPGRDAARATALVVGVHLLLTLVLALALDDPAAEVGLLRTIAGAAVLSSPPSGGGSAASRGCWTCPRPDAGRSPPAPPRRARRPAHRAGPVHRCRRRRGGVGRQGYATLSGSLGGAAAGRSACSAWAAAPPERRRGRARPRRGPRLLRRRRDARLGARRDAGLRARVPDARRAPRHPGRPLIAFVSQVMPVIAGLVAGRTVGRWFGDEDGGSVVAGLTGLLAGVLLGVVSGVLVWVAGGSLGDGALAQVGAPAWPRASRWPRRAASRRRSPRPWPAGGRSAEGRPRPG